MVVFVGATVAIYFALEPVTGAEMFGATGGVILGSLSIAIDRSWQKQGTPKKRPELA